MIDIIGYEVWSRKPMDQSYNVQPCVTLQDAFEAERPLVQARYPYLRYGVHAKGRLLLYKEIPADASPILPQDEIQRWAAEACVACGHPDLWVGVRFSFARSQRRAIGIAHMSKSRITLSAHHWPTLSAAERRNVIIHEVCHLVVYFVYGGLARAHGTEWKRYMRMAGGRPTATTPCRHDFGIRHDCQCLRCGRIHRHTTREVKDVRSGALSLYCECGGDIVPLAKRSRGRRTSSGGAAA